MDAGGSPVIAAQTDTGHDVMQVPFREQASSACRERGKQEWRCITKWSWESGPSAAFFVLFQGYVVRISGGNDKQGFPMKQGVLTHGRVRLLLSKGHSCYRPRRTGERKRKSVRGCIVDANLSVLNLVIVKKGRFLCTKREDVSSRTL